MARSLKQILTSRHHDGSVGSGLCGSGDFGNMSFVMSEIMSITVAIFITIRYGMDYVNHRKNGCFRVCIGLWRRGVIGEWGLVSSGAFAFSNTPY